MAIFKEPCPKEQGMNIQAKLLCAVAAAGFATLAATSSAQALTLSTLECSVKYHVAKAAGTLNGQKWNDFRIAHCSADATASPAATPAPAAPAAPKEAGAQPRNEAAPAPSPAPSAGPAVTAVDAATPPVDSKGAADPSPPAIASPSNPTSTADVVRAAPTATGCALKYMTAEVAGKLKGRKWKEFRQEECEESTTQAVFPSMVAPKYSGTSPDKARTLTCADQFNANKATDANGGLKWIEKSGGYYGECVSRLKG
jgi:hypothetical protein